MSIQTEEARAKILVSKPSVTWTLTGKVQFVTLESLSTEYVL
jgi:hypothetical protein